MSIFLSIVSIAGWYFLLSMFFGSLHSTVAFSAFGATVSWFGVIFLGGCLGILKLCLGGK